MQVDGQNTPVLNLELKLQLPVLNLLEVSVSGDGFQGVPRKSERLAAVLCLCALVSRMQLVKLVQDSSSLGVGPELHPGCA